MGKNPAFQFYPGDWKRDLDEHPLEIEGAWIRICCRLWWSDTPGKMTKSLKRWSASLGIHHNTCLKIFRYLADNDIGNIEINDGLYTIVNRRMVRDYEIRCLRIKSGTLGGNPNFEKGKSNPYYSKDNISKLDKQNITPSSSSSSSTSKITPPTPQKRGVTYTDEFSAFWKVYPKKVGKDAAWRKWKQLNGTRPALAALVAAIQTQAQSDQWQRDGGQYIPHPAKWLHQGRWADEIEETGSDLDSWARRKQAEMEARGETV